MIFDKKVTVKEIADILNTTFDGNPDQIVTGINEIHRIKNGELTFVDVEKYFKKALNSAATTILINKKVDCPEGKALIFSDEPFTDFNKVLEHFQPRAPFINDTKENIHESVKLGKNVAIGENCNIGQNVEIGHNVVIGNNVSIDEGSIIFPNVTIYDHCVIGKFCVINSGTVIGGEGFYFKKRDWGREKLQSKGRVVLGDYVEIGANTTIDKGVTSDTSVGDHTKIDNLVQIGHDTIIGRKCIIAAQTGIAGCCNIEDEVILWGQSGIPSDVTIGKGVVVMAKSGVMSSIEPGKIVLGFIAKDHKTFLREYACIGKLPEIIRMLESKE